MWNWEEQLKLLYDFAKQMTTVTTATGVILITIATDTKRGVPIIPLLVLATSAGGALYSMVLANWVLRRIHIRTERAIARYLPNEEIRIPRIGLWLILLLSIDLYAVTALVGAVVLYARPGLLSVVARWFGA
jgi:hypothetical protein